MMQHLIYDSYEQKSYHDFQSDIIRWGKWAVVIRKGPTLSTMSLLFPHYRRTIINSLVAGRIERWFTWLRAKKLSNK